MKRLTSIIVMSLVLMLQMSAQENKHPRFNPEEFKAKLEAFITEKADLTQEESKRVLPIYQEMKDKQRKLKQTEWKLKRNAKKLDSDKECQEALMKIVQTRIESAKLEEGYCKKMCKVVPAQKVYAMMLAEDAFHRELLQAAGQRKNKNHNQPPRRP